MSTEEPIQIQGNWSDPHWLGIPGAKYGEMQTWTGRISTPLNLQVDQIHILDIAHHLARINRFNGRTAGVLPVAEHCVEVSRLCPDGFKLTGLLHDAPEAYMGDIIRPIKKLPEFQFYHEAEERAWRAIATKFDLHPVMPPEVIRADNERLEFEISEMIDNPLSWLAPEEAELMFLQEYLRLTQ